MSTKYHNVVTERDGRRFASRAEAQRYDELTILERCGSIMGLVLQPAFELQPEFRDVSGVKHRAIYYVGDFQYTDCETDRWCVEEVKGAETAIWKLKQKMFLFKYPHIELRVLKAR